MGYKLACLPTMRGFGDIELEVKVELKKLTGFNETLLASPDPGSGVAATLIADYPRVRQPIISRREITTTVTASDGSAVAFFLWKIKNDSGTFYKYVFLTPELIE